MNVFHEENRNPRVANTTRYHDLNIWCAGSTQGRQFCGCFLYSLKKFKISPSGKVCTQTSSNKNWTNVTTTKFGHIIWLSPQWIEGIGCTSAKVNYYAALAELNNGQVTQFKIGAIGAEVGDAFVHTSELHVMDYDEAIKSSNAKLCEQEVKHEYTRIAKKKMWKVGKKHTVPKVAKFINSI